MAYQSRYYSS